MHHIYTHIYISRQYILPVCFRFIPGKYNILMQNSISMESAQKLYGLHSSNTISCIITSCSHHARRPVRFPAACARQLGAS